MESRDLFPDQDPPTAAALYLSALDHEHLYSAAELRRAISRAYAAFDRPAALLDLYRRSVHGADAAEHEVRAERRSWALSMASRLARDDDRPLAASPTPAAWGNPVTAVSEPPAFDYASSADVSPSHQAEPGAFPRPRQPTALRELRTARRRPAQVTTAVLGVQIADVCLANEAPGFMAYSWAGPLNIGLTLVLVQLVITGWAVVWYARYARNSLEPMVERHSASFAHLESPR
ncbi:DUF485 domain-containing protein [Streptomyces sp. NPDC019443]|uniref:DUF485 domain-containing protein n=1 Tax=Streptomyces sp. NPDC019443 TaxID=3365061 RepID=UPI0037AB29CB